MNVLEDMCYQYNNYITVSEQKKIFKFIFYQILAQKITISFFDDLNTFKNITFNTFKVS